jgi:hypothetical protein
MGANLAPICLVAAIGDEVDAELALRAFGRYMGLSREDVETFGE